MTGWNCPECGEVQVCSRSEWVSVYNYRAAIKERTRRLMGSLESRGVAVRADESARDACQRWAQAGTVGPSYICASCKRAFTAREVPA